jgi:AraC-like DNA-binding protein
METMLFPGLPPTFDWPARARRAGYRVEALPREMAMSPRTLRRRFREQNGTTPEPWMARLRMADAPVFLCAGWPVKRVAAHLGYRQVSHFCRHFRRHHGLTVQARLRAHRRERQRRSR